MTKEGYGPNKKVNSVSEMCEFHLKGCCFDPQKTVKGFFAAPCFDCTGLDLEQENVSVPENSLE